MALTSSPRALDGDLELADAAAVSPAAAIRTVVLASLGGGLEFYDFVVYGIFASSIAPAFFPSSNGLASLANTFAVFAGGYFIRPLGGFVFSHFGDRFGRRTTFLVSLLGMSLATLGMAVCPSFASWGSGATLVFVLLRLMQGFCLGGELPGAITYVSEASVPGRAGTACGLLFCCASLGVLLGSGVNLLLHALLPAAAAAAMGWRLAFGFGGVLGLLSYLPRRKLQETAVFTRILQHRTVASAPLRLVLQQDGRQVLAGIGTTALVAAFNGVLFAYLPAYLVRVVGYPPAAVALAMTAGLVANSMAVLGTGVMTDLVSLHAVHRFAAVVLLVVSWPFFWLVAAEHTPHLTLAVVVFGAAVGLAGGSFAPILPRLFAARVRYSGVAVAYNISFAVFSGLAPLIATALIAGFGDNAAPGYYLTAIALLAFAATLWVRSIERRRT